MEKLHITCAKMRMIRGQTQYNKMSRFVKEIPTELFEIQPQKEKFVSEEKISSYQQAKLAFRTKPVTKQFSVTKADSLDYNVGDTVLHKTFGEGLVIDITEGGRDYEVTVEFGKVGVKKMFASFAKLQKV